MESGRRTRTLQGLFSAVALVVAFVSMVVCLSFMSSIKADIADKDQQNDVPASNVGNEIAKYRAEVENGYVVVRDADGDAVMTFKTPVKLMTEVDREYFENGVDIYSDEELATLSEDFGS